MLHTDIRHRFFNHLLIAFVVLTFSLISKAAGQTTEFTYQGRLTDAGSPGDGMYDMRFKVFDTPTVGMGIQQGRSVARRAGPTATLNGFRSY